VTSYTVATPELLASAATEVGHAGSRIAAAATAAASPTTGLVAAAGDEISAGIAKLFGSYGEDYQAILARAAVFHEQFTATLAAAAGAYAAAETAGAALLGRAPGAGPASAATVTALIMGGTSNPVPDPQYVQDVFASYIQPKLPSAIPLGVFTPEQFWPVTPTLGNLTFGQSVAQGLPLLNAAITANVSPGHNAVVFGYSQSAAIATEEIRALMAAGSPDTSQLSFVLVGNPNNPNGGLLERFPGFYVPFLDVAFNGATPPNSPYPTTVYTLQYDGFADFPQYPLNVVSDVNAIMGSSTVHATYPLLTATQVADAVPLPTNGGTTRYYMIPTQNLPLLQPIRDIPLLGPPLADLVQPDLRVMVDLGYSDYGAGLSYANVPTPAGLFSLPNPLTVVPDLAVGAVQGPYGAVVQIGVEAGLTSPSYFPDAYPWVPSVDPGLHVFLGQPSTTVLSRLSGAVGSALSGIPPILN
jgi:hypothetical protein